MPGPTVYFAYFFAIGPDVVWASKTADGLRRQLQTDVVESDWPSVLDFIDSARPGEFREVVLKNGVRVQVLRYEP